MFEKKSKNGVTVKAYRGDTMTLLAFDISDELLKDTFVGFSVKVKTPHNVSYYLFNRLNFQGSDDDETSDTAPFQKFRWIHVAGLHHQKLNEPECGKYTYYVTPRYWDSGKDSLAPLNPDLTVDLEVDVDRFVHKWVELGFTRSFLASQAYNRWFGAENANFTPENWWMKDTAEHFCTHDGKDYPYETVYAWLGYSAREKTLGLLTEVLADENKSVDIFAYDLNEPRIIQLCRELAQAGRIRMILDNSIATETDEDTGEKTVSGHGAEDSPETWFENTFNTEKTGNAGIWRGKYSRFAHDKVIIVKNNGRPVKVLTGSTNFSVTGFCVNANHIAIFDHPEIAELYENVFETCFGQKSMTTAFKKTAYATSEFRPGKGDLPDTTVTFAPHDEAFAKEILDDLAGSITGDNGAQSSVLFSVMQLTSTATGPVYPTLREVQKNDTIFSYGITDSTKAVSLYKPGSRRGILVNAKSLCEILPPPFDKEATFNAHNIHNKFVVIDFNTPDARVYFGSSNLTLGGEKANGDNLLCIRDTDIATVFAVQAIGCIDHYHFRAKKSKYTKKDPLKLVKDSSWAKPYFDENDIKFIDRKLFAS